MAIMNKRASRGTRVFRVTAAANLTDVTLLAAPGDGRRWVIDSLYFNTSVAGTVEFKQAAGAATNNSGLLGGVFGANGGFISPIMEIEADDNQPVIVTTTGVTPNIYLTLIAHVES